MTEIRDIFRAPNGDEFHLSECGSRHIMIIECVFKDQVGQRIGGCLVSRLHLIGHFECIPDDYVNVYRVWRNALKN